TGGPPVAGRHRRASCATGRVRLESLTYEKRSPVSDDLERPLLEAFRTECREHVDGIRSALAAVAAGEASAADLEAAYRGAHGLKAAARVCDLAAPAALAQRLEGLFSRARHGAVALAGEALVVTCQAADALEDWSRAWEAGQ